MALALPEVAGLLSAIELASKADDDRKRQLSICNVIDEWHASFL